MKDVELLSYATVYGHESMILINCFVRGKKGFGLYVEMIVHVSISPGR